MESELLADGAASGMKNFNLEALALDDDRRRLLAGETYSGVGVNDRNVEDQDADDGVQRGNNDRHSYRRSQQGGAATSRGRRRETSSSRFSWVTTFDLVTTADAAAAVTAATATALTSPDFVGEMANDLGVDVDTDSV